MITQMDLPLSRVSKNKHDEKLRELIALLSEYRGPVRASVIQLQIGLGERAIRDLAQNSSGRIIGDDDGYTLIDFVTHEKMARWESRYRSQINRMLERVAVTCKAWHSRTHTEAVMN